MAEEQACLVRAHSDSENSSRLGSFGSMTKTMTYREDRLTGGQEGAGEPGNSSTLGASPMDCADNNESGELIDYTDAGVLEQFHEDAIRQSGCGVSQVRVWFASSLALSGAALELAAIPFVLPSAEIELCILTHEKNWLVLISLVGGSLGAIFWGVLADRLGRRRALASCLAVNSVFAAVAAFMPTYGTFMMARFCSAVGSGGILPACVTYTLELAPRAFGPRTLGPLLAARGGGALLAALLAGWVLPQTGAEALRENKEHFSAWHRYLLLCILPLLASLMSLIWTPESPRYLLDVGGDVDAMMLYQKIHSHNQSLACAGSVSPTGASRRLGELTLPGKRRPQLAHKVSHSLKLFWQAFFQLFSSAYRNITLGLIGTLVFTMAIEFYLSTFIPATVLRMDNQVFAASRRSVSNETFANEYYNASLVNVAYENVTFDRCDFHDMMMSHVTFRGCSFYNVAFTNIKTSFTRFESSLLVNNTIIDTDIELGHEILDSCTLNGTIIRGMVARCGRDADLMSDLKPLIKEQTYVANAIILGALASLLPNVSHRNTMVAICLLITIMSPSIYIATSETALYIVEAGYRLFLTVIFFAVCESIVKKFPANLRCTAHGLIMSIALMASAIVKGISDANPVASCVLCSIYAILAAASAMKLR